MRVPREHGERKNGALKKVANYSSIRKENNRTQRGMKVWEK